jgi:hypothetical protein
MAPLDVAKELAEILTSAFGKGWGWAAVLLLVRALKKHPKKPLMANCVRYTTMSINNGFED